MILTLDLGTTVTKADAWDRSGAMAGGRAALVTRHPRPGWDEQDPASWWRSIVDACAQVRAANRAVFEQITAVVLTSARQTLALVDHTGRPVSAGILWSDRRAGVEAARLVGGPGGIEAARRRAGVYVNAGSVVAKLAWLVDHEPDQVAAARWVLSPRDLAVWRLSGRVVTDWTLASASGLWDLDQQRCDDWLGEAAPLVPDPLPSDTIVGPIERTAADQLGLRPDVVVILGAGDRPAEAMGTAATTSQAMVSWGTTANVSVLRLSRPDPIPAGLVLSRAAGDGGWLLEGGLAAAGSLVDWLAAVTGLSGSALLDAAGSAPAGSHGVVALPWLGGARAPWWRDDATAGFLGLAATNGPGDLARAVLEGVARDVDRCLAAMATGPDASSVEALALAGRGAAMAVWVDILMAITGRPATIRRSASTSGSAQAASVGAALMAAGALNENWTLDELDPVVRQCQPNPELVERYHELGQAADRAAAATIDLRLGPS